MGGFDVLYKKLPLSAQHLAVSIFGTYWYWLRFGTGYKRYVTEYRERERYSSNEMEIWQQRQLQNLLKACVSKVKYYSHNWSKNEKAAALSARLEELPLLNKSTVRQNPEEFLRQDMKPLPRLVFHTSGSSGTPIASIWTVKEVRNSLALREVRSLNWAGVSYRMPRGTFSGRMVEPDPDSKGPFYRFNIIENQIYFSAFHLRPETAGYYVNALHRHGIQWLNGYAVSYYLLAKFIIAQDLRVPPLKAVITTSEKLTEEMRRVMETAYGCRIYEEYGTVENAVFASECEHGRLHVSPDAGIVEILDASGQPCEPGKTGEVVTTCLKREYQPFIRYRLGDLAMWDAQECPCGRNMPILKEVVGRIEDVVIGPDGRQMVRFHGIFADQPNVQEGQIIQETLNRIRVRVVSTGTFGAKDVQDITNRIRQRLGPSILVIVEPVESISRTTAGKFQAVISLLREKGVVEAERMGMSSTA
jgi:phenylacetate-CoA ligase